MGINPALYWVLKYRILSQKKLKSESSCRRFKGYINAWFGPRAAASIVNTLQERPTLLSTQIKLSNIKSDFNKYVEPI